MKILTARSGRFPVRDDDGRSLRYRTVAFIVRTGLRAFYGRQLVIEGVENIPADGPLLVVCNHLSYLDPLLIGAVMPRTLFAMAKRELFPGPIARWIWAGCNTFPIERDGTDRRAVRTAVGLLKQRRRLLLFIEGHRSRGAGMQRALPGVGFLARRGNAAVLPVAVWGTEHPFIRVDGRRRRNTVHLRYGPVLPPPDSREDQAFADNVAAHIAAMLPASYRGIHAIQPVGQPY